MKRMKAALASTLALTLVLLAPGGQAYAQVARISGATGSSSASGAAASISANSAALPAGVLPLSFAAPLLGPSFSGLPAFVPVSASADASSARAGVPNAPVAIVPAAAIGGVIPAQAIAVSGRSTPISAISGRAASAASESQDMSRRENGVESAAASAALRFDGSVARINAAPESLPVRMSAAGESKNNLRKSDKKGMPDSADSVDGTGNVNTPTPDLDELGNPRREQTPGPDDRTDPDAGRGGGNSGLFGLALGAGMLGMISITPIITYPILLLSLVLHEIGHARVATWLGDPSPRFHTYQTMDLRNIFSYFKTGVVPMKTVTADRTSLNPRTWGSHIHPILTVVLPLYTMMIGFGVFGGARPVEFDESYFKNRRLGTALSALAGPGVNVLLAGAGALAFAGAAAAGLGAVMLGVLSTFIFVNVILAMFNLLPIRPLDGGHILASLLPPSVSAKLDSLYDRLRFGRVDLSYLPLILVVIFLTGTLGGAAAFVTAALTGGALALTGSTLAGLAAPAVLTVAMAMGTTKPADNAGKAPTEAAALPGAPNNPNSAATDGSAPVDLVVVFSKSTLTKDLHLSSVDTNLPDGVDLYAQTQQQLLAQLAASGLDAVTMASYGATPLASYRRINAATIRVDGAHSAEFMAMLTAAGHVAYANARREIVRPVPISPDNLDPNARGAVTMDENLVITKADKVQKIATARWGKPDLGILGRFWNKVTGATIPQPKVGVIDSGADTTHPLLKRIKEVKNATSGENIDDIGHGSWVHSTVLHMAPWSKNSTHYKTFLNGGATLDDILKALTQAGNDGNLVISNSWGSDDGDPTSPDSQLVRKLAEEGHIMVFAAGNAGSDPNTIGSPAIVTYKDAESGAIRVLAVAAADRNKKIAYFSSRGPGSQSTKKDPNYPHRPDLTGVGYNIEGAWPAALGDADRRDPVAGPLKAISGTSMSTPGVAGAIVLLMMMFGVTEKGKKLDAVVNAVMGTLEKTGQHRDAEGEGFINVEAAYNKLLETIGPDSPSVLEYRTLTGRLTVLRRASVNVSLRSVLKDDEVAKMKLEIDSIEKRLAAMKASEPDLAYRSAGRIKRFFLRLFGVRP